MYTYEREKKMLLEDGLGYLITASMFIAKKEENAFLWKKQ